MRGDFSCCFFFFFHNWLWQLVRNTNTQSYSQVGIESCGWSCHAIAHDMCAYIQDLNVAVTQRKRAQVRRGAKQLQLKCVDKFIIDFLLLFHIAHCLI